MGTATKRFWVRTAIDEAGKACYAVFRDSGAGTPVVRVATFGKDRKAASRACLALRDLAGGAR